jgi:hypothetical protein
LGKLVAVICHIRLSSFIQFCKQNSTVIKNSIMTIILSTSEGYTRIAIGIIIGLIILVFNLISKWSNKDK